MKRAGPERILVIDDAKAVRDLIREILEDEGYEVAVMGHDGCNLEEIRRFAPDLIVLDIPRCEPQIALQWLEELCRDLTDASIPVVLCTGAVDVTRRMDDGLAAELAGLVIQPFDIEVLLQEIEHAWHQTSHAPPSMLLLEPRIVRPTHPGRSMSGPSVGSQES